MSNRPDVNVNTRVRQQPVGDHSGQKIAEQQGRGRRNDADAFYMAESKSKTIFVRAAITKMMLRSGVKRFV